MELGKYRLSSHWWTGLSELGLECNKWGIIETAAWSLVHLCPLTVLHIAPPGWEHISFNGDYVSNREFDRWKSAPRVRRCRLMYDLERILRWPVIGMPNHRGQHPSEPLAHCSA